MSTAGKESGWKKVRGCGMIPSGCDLKQMAEVSMDKDWEKYLPPTTCAALGLALTLGAAWVCLGLDRGAAADGVYR